jgi:glutamate-5-semialdehyde dehydrogenase
MKLLVGGDQVLEISPDLAAAFAPGDRLAVVEKTGQVLHIPARDAQLAEVAVADAYQAFARMAAVTDAQIARFYEEFASRIEQDAIWRPIQSVNDEDVARAKARGRSTTRLVADDRLRRNVIDGLRGWITAPSRRGQVIETVQHQGWRAELVGAELGVVGFVFEGRPNVVADATGVLRGGNTVVFRIGSDALATAKAIMERALRPALKAAGLPETAVSVVDSASHAAGWAMFSDPRLSLAVARGSGRAVDTLGSLAQKAGIPVSLHGTGGAWMVLSEAADPAAVERAVSASLDRKVCNTLNTLCVPLGAAARLLPAALAGLQHAGERLQQAYKLHVIDGDVAHLPRSLFENRIHVQRAEGDVEEPQAEPLPEAQLGTEWEWEGTPEITLKLVESIEQAVGLFNRYSPQFVATLISPDREEHNRFYQSVNAPFVGDGFTRWVDGQFALSKPELGLSNWQNGRLFGRGGVLSGDSVFTVRTRVVTEDV